MTPEGPRKHRQMYHAMLSILVSLALLFPGCIDAGTNDPKEPVQEGTAAIKSPDGVYRVSLDASSFQEGHDWALIRATSDGRLPDMRMKGSWTNHNASIEEAPDYLFEEYRRPCYVFYGMAEEGVNGWLGIHNGFRHGVSIHTEGVDRDIEYSNAHDGAGYDYILGAGGINDTIYYLVGLTHISNPWPDDMIFWNMTSYDPYQWSVIASGTMQCGSGPEDFDEGEYTWIEPGASYFHGEGFRKTLDFEQAGLLVTVADAQNIDAEVQRNGSQVWAHTANLQTQEGKPAAAWWVKEPAQYEFLIHEIQNSGWFPFLGYLAIDGLTKEVMSLLPTGNLLASSEDETMESKWTNPSNGPIPM